MKFKPLFKSQLHALELPGMEGDGRKESREGMLGQVVLSVDLR